MGGSPESKHMPQATTAPGKAISTRTSRAGRDWLIILAAVIAAGISGTATKRGGFGPAFVALASVSDTAPAPERTLAPERAMPMIAASMEPEEISVPVAIAAPQETAPSLPAGVVGTLDLEPGHARYFNGRPIRAVRTMTMTVTAYSPDARSCGKFADGITASLKSVWTNGMRLVAADSRLLPIGSIISVPGYAGGDVVPVLDRGGAIKGHRLDVLYPTHEIARQWGVQKVPVTVWEYADEG